MATTMTDATTTGVSCERCAPVPTWVRIGLLALAVPQLITGAWAVLAPRSWFDDFPLVGPSLVAAEPPFNAHLATDAGAGFLATGVALAVAALAGRRALAELALLTFLVFAVPHVFYHWGHHAPDMTGVENATNVAMLVGGVVLAGVLAWGARRQPS